MTSLADRLGECVYLDANIYIYAFERVAAFDAAIDTLYRALEASAAPIIASQLLLPELMAKQLREGRADLVEAYDAYLRETPQIRLAPVTEPIILRATVLRAEHGLKTVDALHLATALEHGCDSFVTNDRGFPELDEVRILDLRHDIA